MLKDISFQEYLSIGYLFLVVLGVTSETIFYGFLDVNYLEYVSILDALLTPISLLNTNKILFGVLIFFSFLLLFWVVRAPKVHEKYKDKKWYQKFNRGESEKKGIKLDEKKGLLQIILYFLFALILGFRIGAGVKYKKKLEQKKFESDYVLVFKDNTELRVKKIGVNSAYVFYVEDNDDTVTITPIADNIKQIKRIKKEK